MRPETDWKIERALEIFLLLIVIAALAGAAGGIRSPRVADASSPLVGLHVKYPRIALSGETNDLTVTVKNKSSRDAGNVMIGMDSRYFSGLMLERINPHAPARHPPPL